VTQRQPAFQTLLILWLALVASQFLFLVPLLVIPPPPEPTDPVLPVAMGVVAMGLGVAVLVVPKASFRRAVLTQRIPLIQVPDPNALPGFNKTLSAPEDPAAAVRGALPAFQIRTILGCALSEAITLLGFVQKFLGFGWEVAVPFFALGIGLTVLQRPSEARLVAALEDALGVPLRQS
jgi:hypothetical protein